MTPRIEQDAGARIPCESARALVPSFLDGELSEAQSSPLRTHLLDCPSCREVAKQERALKRWFQEPATVEIPLGFAARVARRAFAGDPGSSWDAELQPAPRRHLSFLLAACAVAAAILLVLALAIRSESLPRTNDMEAQQYRPPWLPAEVTPARAEPLPRIQAARPASAPATEPR